MKIQTITTGQLELGAFYNILMEETEGCKMYEAINIALSAQLAFQEMGSDLPDFPLN
ncbi:hypothetical protein ATE92_1755 [Ulvibacter sp. MAR_2010_11]|uniref:hypothetical protein n=1 Tax=Ulvibacter sp. MAR_2010_11 TaxID=1250229 RepID=UPI000CAA2273|nr:hypothetical protein [Ulvibacter sp. MAR_2010_11]PKA83598.1 hypothetical protein ATE92_1755 [Ulvibacter sp. MAR_2010_11]